MKLDLQDNAIDSFLRSVKYFNEGGESGIKAATKELGASVELFLKEKLRQLDLSPDEPVLIYEQFCVKVDHSTQTYRLEPKARGRTVTLEGCIERLAWLGYELSGPDKAALKKLKRIRNAAEHLALDLDQMEAEKAYLEVVAFSVQFLHRLLGKAFFDQVGSSWQSLVASHAELRATAAGSAAEAFGSLLHAEQSLAGDTACPSCGATVLLSRRGGHSYALQCGACGLSQEIEECYGCKKDFFLSELVPSEGDTGLCPGCVDS